MRKKFALPLACLFLAALFAVCGFFAVRASFPRPYAEIVKASGLDPDLVYSVMKAESGFDERAVSRAGAVGVMQLLPSTARFICEREKIAYDEEKLREGEYNVKLGTLYLLYLTEKFPVAETALAAYNAGEGVVLGWLSDPTCSDDGKTLLRIPYAESRQYVKKVMNFKKIYEFFY